MDYQFWEQTTPGTIKIPFQCVLSHCQIKSSDSCIAVFRHTVTNLNHSGLVWQKNDVPEKHCISDRLDSPGMP